MLNQPAALDVAALRDQVAGSIVLPGDADWDEARQAWNLAVDQRPAAVAIPHTAEDVSAVVRYAVRQGLRVAPQGTGHNAAPMGSLADTILVKTSAMGDVDIDAAGRRARVGAGVVWAEVTGPASEHGLAPLAGSSPDVGVVGYTLGGGLSWLARKHGLAANSVLAVEIVTADGRIVRADARNETDLFWAVRGGGGSFGIVTAIEFRLYPAPEVYAGMMLWPWEQGREVLTAWRDFAADAPDEVTTSFRYMQIPALPDIPEFLQNRAFAVIDGAYLGDEGAAVEALASLRALGPEIDTFAMVPPAALSHIHMDPEHPVPAIGDGLMLGDLDDAGLDAFEAVAGPGSGSPLLMVELRQLGGAVNRPAVDHGAQKQFEGTYAFFSAGIPMTPELGVAIEAHNARIRGALAAYEAGRPYLNFQERPYDTSASFTPEAYRRLQAIKADVDPQDVFRANHPIAPAHAIARAA